MARSSIPDFGIEYPEYKYRAWPKYVGLTAEGEALIAQDKAEYDEMKELAVYPKLLGKDKHGNDVIAQNPRDESWFKHKVVGENTLTGEPEVRRGPGRPAKVA
jgi:hypothetical protein